LNTTRWRTGSQCSCRNTGVMYGSQGEKTQCSKANQHNAINSQQPQTAELCIFYWPYFRQRWSLKERPVIINWIGFLQVQSINQREICRAPLYDTSRSANSSQWKARQESTLRSRFDCPSCGLVNGSDKGELKTRDWKCRTNLQDWKTRDWKRREQTSHGKTIKPKQRTHSNSRR